jgi:predicted transport protein
MIIYKNENKYKEYKYPQEDEFERDIVNNYKLFFGKNTILIDSKKKIDSKSLGGSIPDAFLFDFSDVESPEFYLIEAELVKHDFFNHIFPQITKFFAFFKNNKSQKDLIDKIYSIVNTDDDLKRIFKKFIGDKEIFKYISDTIENSQNILLILDGNKIELPEITETYTDTWGKLVKIQVIRKYYFNNEIVYSMEPDFESIEYLSYEDRDSSIDHAFNISEEYHLEDVNQNVKDIYHNLKNNILNINSKLVFNPQKYYISIINKKNVIFLKFRKKKIRMIVMLPYNEINSNINKHEIKILSQPVQDFYNGDCAAIDIEDLSNIQEIIELIRTLIS